MQIHNSDLNPPPTPASSHASSTTILPSFSVKSYKNLANDEVERGRSLSRSSFRSSGSSSGVFIACPPSSVSSSAYRQPAATHSRRDNYLVVPAGINLPNDTVQDFKQWFLAAPAELDSCVAASPATTSLAPGPPTYPPKVDWPWGNPQPSSLNPTPPSSSLVSAMRDGAKHPGVPQELGVSHPLKIESLPIRGRPGSPTLEPMIFARSRSSSPDTPRRTPSLQSARSPSPAYCPLEHPTYVRPRSRSYSPRPSPARSGSPRASLYDGTRYRQPSRSRSRDSSQSGIVYGYSHPSRRSTIAEPASVSSPRSGVVYAYSYPSRRPSPVVKASPQPAPPPVIIDDEREVGISRRSPRSPSPRYYESRPSSVVIEGARGALVLSRSPSPHSPALYYGLRAPPVVTGPASGISFSAAARSSSPRGPALYHGHGSWSPPNLAPPPVPSRQTEPAQAPVEVIEPTRLSASRERAPSPYLGSRPRSRSYSARRSLSRAEVYDAQPLRIMHHTPVLVRDRSRSASRGGSIQESRRYSRSRSKSPIRSWHSPAAPPAIFCPTNIRGPLRSRSRSRCRSPIIILASPPRSIRSRSRSPRIRIIPGTVRRDVVNSDCPPGRDGPVGYYGPPLTIIARDFSLERESVRSRSRSRPPTCGRSSRSSSRSRLAVPIIIPAHPPSSIAQTHRSHACSHQSRTPLRMETTVRRSLPPVESIKNGVPLPLDRGYMPVFNSNGTRSRSRDVVDSPHAMRAHHATSVDRTSRSRSSLGQPTIVPPRQLSMANPQVPIVITTRRRSRSTRRSRSPDNYSRARVRSQSPPVHQHSRRHRWYPSPRRSRSRSPQMIVTPRNQRSSRSPSHYHLPTIGTQVNSQRPGVPFIGSPVSSSSSGSRHCESPVSILGTQRKQSGSRRPYSASSSSARSRNATPVPVIIPSAASGVQAGPGYLPPCPPGWAATTPPWAATPSWGPPVCNSVPQFIPPWANTVSGNFKHPRFWFADGSITVIVENTEYRLHRYLFEHTWWYLGTGEPVYWTHTKQDFDRFLSVLYPSDYSEPECKTTDEWASVLAVANQGGFVDMQRLAVKKLAVCAGPVDKIALGHRYGIKEWLGKAYCELAMRREPITAADGMKLGVDALVRIGAIKDELMANLTAYIDEKKLCDLLATKLAF